MITDIGDTIHLATLFSLFAVTTTTTVGYGDFVTRSPVLARLICSVYILFGTLVLTSLLLEPPNCVDPSDWIGGRWPP